MTIDMQWNQPAAKLLLAMQKLSHLSQCNNKVNSREGEVTVQLDQWLPAAWCHWDCSTDSVSEPLCVAEPPPTYEESCSSANASFSSQQ